MKGLRIELGLSQDDFAKKLGTTQSRISDYENGKARITLEKLNEFCNKANLTVEIIVK